jgi:hypothetical protein
LTFSPIPGESTFTVSPIPQESTFTVSPTPGNGTFMPLWKKLLNVGSSSSRSCQVKSNEIAMFVIGSNNLQQTAERLKIPRSSLRFRPAKLVGYKREFVGLSTTRSHGAVANARKSFDSALKGGVMFLPKKNREGKNSLNLMDGFEGVAGGQYKREHLNVACYPREAGGVMRMIKASVYVMTSNRAKKMTQSRSGGSNTEWPFRSWNNGFVSIDYITAVRKMLDETWGSNYDPTKEFSPSASLKMFEWRDCRTRRVFGKIKKYTKKITNPKRACPLGEVVKSHVKKYRVKEFVRQSNRRKVRA